MMDQLLKFYECKICGTSCIGMPFDGEIFVKEVCSEDCLAELAGSPTPRQDDCITRQMAETLTV